MYKYNNHVKRDKERRKLQSVLANPMVYLQQGNQVHKGHICCLGNKNEMSRYPQVCCRQHTTKISLHCPYTVV